jgi:6,7-dimethyl-8-ribityllumazine synthase
MTTKTFSIAILAAEFNKPLVDFMVDAAHKEAVVIGADVVRTVRVPGSYEMPLVADRLLAQPDVDAVVVLGYIERGETLHGEVMGHVVHAALVDRSLVHGKPVGIGIIGPGAVVAQAEKRKDDYARAAVRASIASCRVLAGLQE